MASDLIGRVGNCWGGIVAGVEVNRISVSRNVASVLYIGTPPVSKLEKRGEVNASKESNGLGWRFVPGISRSSESIRAIRKPLKRFIGGRDLNPKLKLRENEMLSSGGVNVMETEEAGARWLSRL